MKEKIIKNETEKVFIAKNEEEFRKSQKAFTFTILDNTSGKVLVNKQTNIILGVYNDIEEATEDFIAIGCINAVHCNKQTQLHAGLALNKMASNYSKKLMPETLKNLLDEMFGGNNE